jgi:hypothetical protein
MESTTFDFSGQGKVYEVLPDFTTRFFHNVEKLSLTFKTSFIDRKESMSGQRLTAIKLLKEKSVELAMTLSEWTLENVALGVQGEVSTMAGASVTGYGLGTATVGKRYVLPHQKLSAVTVKDFSDTIIDATDYSLDTTFGAITFNDLTGYTGPFNISYTYGTTDGIGFFTQSLSDRVLRFEGLNTAQGNKPVLLTLYRVQLNPPKGLELISEKLESLDMTGEVMVDMARPEDATLGRFGSIVFL